MIHRRVDGPPPVDVARTLWERRPGGVVFLDSGRAAGATAANRAPLWSIVAAAPTVVLTEQGGRFIELPSRSPVFDPVAWMASRLSAGPRDLPADLPFVGGLAGFLGFEFGWTLDEIRAPWEEAEVPRLWVGWFPSAALYAHREECWHLVGERSDQVEALEGVLRQACSATTGDCVVEAAELLVSPETYLAGVAACRQAIWEGELFEINYTERFGAAWSGEPFAFFEALRAHSTGAYGGFLGADSFQLASVSPEQFLGVNGRQITTRPIKGTRRRSDDAAEDRRLAQELVASEKDRAENVMIVDLMRNDLTRICEPGSVHVSELCALESYAGVHHLVSTVCGELAKGLTPIDALLACFPAGSITGAPKLRSIEYIARLEHSPRGAYTGSMFYASQHGRLDSNVLIRTASLVDGTARYGAGGAVVADSDPGEEHREACVKAEPFIKLGRRC